MSSTLILQRKKFDLLVAGHPGLGVRPPGDLVAADVVIHQQQRHLQRQPGTSIARWSNRTVRSSVNSGVFFQITPRQRDEQMSHRHQAHVMVPPDHDRVSYRAIPR